MKKELAQHFFAFLILFFLISLLRHYWDISFWPFWVGGLIGTILPDIDHIIYIYYLRPHELTSQRIASLNQKGDLWESWDLLATTRFERLNLIFHNSFFQVFFIILSFLVISSSSSLLGHGIVIAFLLHLLVDQIIDLKVLQNISHWFQGIQLELDKTQINIYLIANLIIILIFGFLM